MKPTAALPLAEFSIVTTVWNDHSEASHTVHRSEIDAFVKATLRLHYEPGVNPHNGKKTAEMCEISAQPLVAAGPFWWTTPDLQKNDDKSGATVFQGGRKEIKWRHPDYQAALDLEYREELEAERVM